MRYVDPNQPDSKVHFEAQYENFIGGEWSLRSKVNTLTTSLR